MPGAKYAEASYFSLFTPSPARGLSITNTCPALDGIVKAHRSTRGGVGWVWAHLLACMRLFQRRDRQGAFPRIRAVVANRNKALPNGRASDSRCFRLYGSARSSWAGDPSYERNAEMGHSNSLCSTVWTWFVDIRLPHLDARQRRANGENGCTPSTVTEANDVRSAQPHAGPGTSPSPFV